MREPPYDGPGPVSLTDLAQSLFDMRDALVRIALLLRDQEFEFNQLRRDETQLQVQELVQKLNNR